MLVIDAEGTVLLVTTMQPLALPTRPGFLFSTAWWSVEKMLSAENGLGAGKTGQPFHFSEKHITFLSSNLNSY
jgi:hypothetical protein